MTGGRKMKRAAMDGAVTRQTGEKRGRSQAWWEEGELDDSAAHHSRVCVQTLVKFWKKKRFALQ